MCNVNKIYMVVIFQLLKKVYNVHSQGGIDHSHRLIRHDQLRPRDQCPGNGNTLQLSPWKLIWEFPLDMFHIKPHLCKGFPDFFGSLFFWPDSSQITGCLVQIAVHGSPGAESGKRILENRLHHPSEFLFSLVVYRKIFTSQGNIPAPCLQKL